MSVTITRKLTAATGLLASNNLGDVANAATSRANLSAAASGANTDLTSIALTASSSLTGASTVFTHDIGSVGGNRGIVKTGANASFVNIAAISMNGDLTDAGIAGLFGGGQDNTYVQAKSSGAVILRTNGNTTAATFSAAQALRLHAYGAGTLTTDSSGNVTATSDARAKNILGDFTTGLAAIQQLSPKKYQWKESTGLNTADVNVSLIAQDLIDAGLAEAVSTERTVPVMESVTVDGKLVSVQKIDAQGKPVTEKIAATYTVSDRVVIAALVNCVKELAARVEALES